MPKFRSRWANLIQDAGSISIDIFVELYHEFVVERVKKVDQSNNNLVDVSLLRALCNWLENALDKKEVVDEKVNKKKIVLDEYIRLKPQCNNEQTKELLDKLIEDLHNSNQIQKVSKNTKLYHKIKSLVLSTKK
jgi:hypothetical protein